MDPVPFRPFFGANRGGVLGVRFGQERVATGAEGKVDVGAVKPHRMDEETAGVHRLLLQDEQPVTINVLTCKGPRIKRIRGLGINKQFTELLS